MDVVLDQYSDVPCGKPVQYGHIMKKITAKMDTMKQINEWATKENKINGFPPVAYATINKCKKLLSCENQSISEFTEKCQIVSFKLTKKLSTSPKFPTHVKYSYSNGTPSRIQNACPLANEVVRRNKELTKLRKELALVQQKTKSLKEQIKSHKLKQEKKIFMEDEMREKIQSACLVSGVTESEAPHLVNSLLTTLRLHQQRHLRC